MSYLSITVLFILGQVELNRVLSSSAKVIKLLFATEQRLLAIIIAPTWPTRAASRKTEKDQVTYGRKSIKVKVASKQITVKLRAEAYVTIQEIKVNVAAEQIMNYELILLILSEPVY